MNELSKDLVSTNEAAKLSGFTQEYIRILYRTGKIAGYKVGITILISKESLMKYQERQKVKEG